MTDFRAPSHGGGLLRMLLATAAIALIPMGASGSSSDSARIRAAENGLRPAIEVVGEPVPRWSIQERMKHWNVPGVSVAVIRDGKLAWAKGYGVKDAATGERIDPQTVFSVGSVSKVGAAAVTLRLVQAGQLDLDRDVNEYLSQWRVPQNAYTAIRPVTLRGLLSHTAGLNVHGFPDYAPDAALPTILDTLQGRAPARMGPVQVIHLPGSRLLYSGGGTTVEQLIVEERTQSDFTTAARRWVFEPLGMNRSTYQNPLPASHGNIAKAHDRDGKPTALPRGWESMPEAAASGLWTTPTDLAKLINALGRAWRGEDAEFLSTPLAREMMTEVGPSRAGLGPFLEGRGVTRRFMHSGSNDSYKAWIEGHLATGDGLIILTNGRRGFRLISELRRSIAVAEGWAMTGVQAVPKLELPPAALEEFTGIYEVDASTHTVATRHGLSAPVAYKVALQDGRLQVSDAGGTEGFTAVPEDPTHFIADDDTDVRVEFVRGYSGKIERLIHRYGSDYAVEATRVRAAQP